MSFRIFLIWSSGGPRVQWSKTIYAIVKEGIIGNIHVKLCENGPVVQEMSFTNISYLGLVLPFCSVERNHLCNFGKGLYEEQFCEIILNLDQWFRRCLLKIFLILRVCGVNEGGQTSSSVYQAKYALNPARLCAFSVIKVLCNLYNLRVAKALFSLTRLFRTGTFCEFRCGFLIRVLKLTKNQIGWLICMGVLDSIWETKLYYKLQ